MNKLRLLHITLQPVFVLEDENGEFEPGPPMQPQEVKLSNLPYIEASLLAHMADLQAKLDQAMSQSAPTASDQP